MEALRKSQKHDNHIASIRLYGPSRSCVLCVCVCAIFLCIFGVACVIGMEMDLKHSQAAEEIENKKI